MFRSLWNYRSVDGRGAQGVTSEDVQIADSCLRSMDQPSEDSTWSSEVLWSLKRSTVNRLRILYYVDSPVVVEPWKEYCGERSVSPKESSAEKNCSSGRSMFLILHIHHKGLEQCMIVGTERESGHSNT